jgi:hypothetical protein
MISILHRCSDENLCYRVVEVHLSGLVALPEHDTNTACLKYINLYLGAEHFVSSMASMSLNQEYTASMLVV